ncbi:ASCH domain-containing protein [Luteibacter aegosomatissinici]|uniref:ASCH domain-containing protein n=1 Tax=Luteibacter aegosomatissinici TaxID=2911539 RepID=UPI001FFB6EC6|nr:ASCH domain-containing protein [Luteibacter aegosomatissinici]UPG92673.1 ASCH domain-containing protein [Luteibacter aegosomatissinici]
MQVLLSIHPEHADKILSGHKRYEFRKNFFKNPAVTKVLIYATMPVGKVIGDFEIGEVIDGSPSTVWETTKNHAGISRKFFRLYFSGRQRAIAIGVRNPRRFDLPRALDEVEDGMVAPQSFRYVDPEVSAHW